MDFLFERLAWLAGQAPENTPWRADVLSLCQPAARRGQSMEQAGGQMVEAARMLRATHQIAAEAYYYVVAWLVEHLAEDEVSHIYAADYAPRFQAIERKYSMQPNWEFREGQEPPEYVVLSNEFEQRMVAVTARMFREYREPVLAELYERDRSEFLRIKQVGRTNFLGNEGTQPATAS